MADTTVRLEVPAKPSYARTVRMLVANLAVLCDMTLDEVEDARVAAGEAFAYVCATAPDICTMSFTTDDSTLCMEFSLGDSIPEENEDASEWVEMTKLLLAATSDSFEMLNNRTVLRVTKASGVAHVG